MVGQSIMPVLIVDLAGRGVREGLVGFCDFEEFLFVTRCLVRVVLLGEGSVGSFQVSFVAGFVKLEDFVEVLLGGGETYGEEGEEGKDS